MNKNSKEKIIVFFLGFIFLVIILEIILKMLGILYINLSNPSQTSFKNNDNVYRIMCIGESTTANFYNHKGYPFFLEKILNEKNLKIKFKVFNLGRPARQSFALLDELEDNIKKYNPDMVISMMGANDGQYVINYSNSKVRIKSSVLNMFQWFNFFKRNKFSINQFDNNLNIPFADIGMVKSLRLMTKDYVSQEIIDSAKSNIELYNKYKTIFNANINDFYKLLEYFENASLDTIQNNKLLYAYSYNAIGDKLFKINELEKAKYYYLKAIHTYPSHYDFYHSMLHKIYSMNELENLLKNKIDENLHDPWAYANLAKYYRELRMYTSKTIDLFKKALELGSDDPSVYATVAYLYAVVGIAETNLELINRSEKFFSKALNIAPDYLDTIRKKLMIYDFMNVNHKGEERIDLLKKKENLLLNFVENLALKPENYLNSNVNIHEYYFELGLIYDELKDFKNAEIFYLRANEIADKKNITYLGLKKGLLNFILNLII